jgi:hypothetical protein
MLGLFLPSAMSGSRLNAHNRKKRSEVRADAKLVKSQRL